MKNKYLSYIKNILLPCIVFSSIAGILTGIAIFLFDFACHHVIAASNTAYNFIRENPLFLPLLIICAGILGLISARLLKYEKNCRGGGIPTSVAILRGLISFNWLRNIIVLFFSAMCTYLCGIPLGSEGPSVQMGTAVGRGTVKMFPKKHLAWNKYIMTSGACAGFACATGAPISGIFFAFEEAHRRFSPMIIMAATSSVSFASVTTNLLCQVFNEEAALFDILILPSLPLKYLFLSVVIGIVCGLLSGAFTKIYSKVNVVLTTKLASLPFTLKMISIFALVAIIGFFFSDALGSGHSLIERLLHDSTVSYTIIFILLIRVVLLIFANNIGVTGGLFVPTLTFGAIVGSVLSRTFVLFGICDESFSTVIVVLSIASFLSAFVQTPITSIIFSIEVLGAINNVLPLIVAVIISYITIEITPVQCMYETVIEAKTKEAHKDKTPYFIEEEIEVKKGAFIIGKESRDILWPINCVVVSVKRNSLHSPSFLKIDEGDVLKIHAKTYNKEKTLEEIYAITGNIPE